MSEDMPPSWRSLASAASRSIKGYIAQQRELKQSYPASRGPAPPQATESSSSSGSGSQKKQSWSQWAVEERAPAVRAQPDRARREARDLQELVHDGEQLEGPVGLVASGRGLEWARGKVSEVKDLRRSGTARRAATCLCTSRPSRG